MKNARLLPFMFLTCLTLVSCKKEPAYTTRYDQMLSKNAGTVTAKINGIPWPFKPLNLSFTSADGPSGKTFTFSTEVFGEDKLKYQTLIIGSINRAIGSDTFMSNSKYFHLPQNSPERLAHPFPMFVLGGEDYSETTYDLLQDSSNNLVVTSYNPTNLRIAGNFELTMVRTQGQPSQGAPDTLRFTDGTFDLKINETP